MKRPYVLLVVLVLLIASVLPAAAQGDQTIVEVAQGNEDFSTLVSALSDAGLVETLQGEGPFTVFAPTNAAFEKLPGDTLQRLDTETLQSILTYHVVPGNVMAADIVGLAGQGVTTVQGEPIRVTVEGDAVMVNDATVTMTDIEASNGVIHVIDSLLLPPSVQITGSGPPTTKVPPQALPETGSDNTVPILPIAVLAAGLLLFGGASLLRMRTGRAR